jgi:hypothetical protein
MPDTPFLVEIENAITSGTSAKRLRALKRVSDLFATGSSRYSNDEIAVFDDVLLKLAELVETDARARLARRLAPLPDAPPRMVRALARDRAIEVAGPVLRQSERLAEPDLVESASTQGQDHLFAISQRRTLSEECDGHPRRARRPPRRAHRRKERGRPLLGFRLRQARRSRGQGRHPGGKPRIAPRHPQTAFPQAPAHRLRPGPHET